VFSPIFRLHGTGIAGTHTPWSYGNGTVTAYKRLSRLHEKAAPLIRRLWHEADRRGAPVTRPLWFEDIHDRTGWKQDEEWMLGRNLLVAPVVDENAHSRRVYLPHGCWKQAGTAGSRAIQGGRSVTVHATLRRLPYFSRCGHQPLRTR
jgi:alpha-D-xyloside xylohydrolase